MNAKRMFPLSSLVLILSLLIVPAELARAAGVCYVKWDAAGLNNGSSWENAYADLQSALGGSLCTEVWVAEGTYKPTGGANRAVSFVLRNGVSLYGGFAGTETSRDQRDPAAHLTVLSGEIGEGLGADNSYHVVKSNGTDRTALLDGFTVTAGNADGSFANGLGGGMYNVSSNPSVQNVTFTRNSAKGGGGMYNKSSSPSFTNVTFGNNSASGAGGGMMNVSSSSPSLENVAFIGNSAQTLGGGMANSGGSPSLMNVTFSGNSTRQYGGGMSNQGSSPTLKNVSFTGNSASWDGSQGGGMYNFDSAPKLKNVTFSGNSAVSGGGMYSYENSPHLVKVTFSANSASYGGGMFNDYSSPSLANVTFSGNSAYHGGGMYNSFDSNPSLANVTFSSNSASQAGGMYKEHNSSPVITNSILYGDIGGEIFTHGGTAATVTYSIVKGGYNGTGNLNADPLLGPLLDNGGFTQTMALQAGSPAIDKGRNAVCPSTDQREIVRPQGPRCDIGAYEYPQQKLILASTGVEDGWIRESAEASTTGGTINTSQPVFFVGDATLDRQYRAVLSFDTAGLADNAIITGVTLKFKNAGPPEGTNPFTTHGKLLVDVRKGCFSGDCTLQSTDFQAAPNKAAVMTLTNSPRNGWYFGGMPQTGFAYINKASVTQLRLRFSKDDNDDLGADYLKFYSGDALTASLRPQLIIHYYVP